MDQYDILLVDDNRDLLESTAELLSYIGYSVKTAEDGRAALAVLQMSHIVRVLVTDIVMPGGLDGFELATRAKQLRPELCVVYVTGYAPQLPHGANRVQGSLLVKPWTIDQLESEIRRCLAQSP